MKKILVTGASGFVGKELVNALLTEKHQLIAVVRNGNVSHLSKVPQFLVKSDFSDTDWRSILIGVNVVIHAAARSHILNDSAKDSLEKFRKINTFGTLSLARQAADANVKRFVFISSIGVNGNNNHQAFTESDLPNPQGPYAVSKYEAEQGLLALAKETGMEVVIIRPPLVYGPGAPGNFGNLLTWVKWGVPLPLGAVQNKRSLVALENLVSFIVHCSDYQITPQAANQVFLVSDGESVSTTELLRKVAKALNTKPLLIPMPVCLLFFFAKLFGKEAVANRLFGSLRVDSSKARDLLGWQPVVTMDEQLAKIARAHVKPTDG